MKFIPWRFYFVLFFIALLVVGLIARLVNLTIFQKPFLQREGNARIIRTIQIPAFRGMILDRNGYPLAISTTVYSVWINPREFLINHTQELSTLLSLNPLIVRHIVENARRKGREFFYVKREVAPEIARKISTLRLNGVYLEQDYKRYYPEGEVASHVVGFTNIDDQGQEGLELAYNNWLRGSSGKERVIKDRLGRVIAELNLLQAQTPGKDLVLSLDHHLQYLAYRELWAGVKATSAESGSVVILDVKTGEILAMVNQPSFNPNNHKNTSPTAYRNRAVTDIFEPGSTMKAFSVASVLESGHYQANSIIDTSPGWLRVGHHIVRDEHTSKPLTVSQILQLSSNVGVTKMVLTITPSQLFGMLKRVGFGEVTGIGFPGERAGELVLHPSSDPFAEATLAFGYGVSVTALQLAEAYAVIANRGIKVPLSLLKMADNPVGERVISEKVANQMILLLESVVAKGGTGQSAHIPGYRVAGKTGTAFLASHHGYDKHYYIASFVGMAPVSQPRYIVAVVLRNPQGKKHQGGEVSAPLFQKIMQGLLLSQNIAPDLPES